MINKLGRPYKQVDVDRLNHLLELGVPKTKIAKHLGIGRTKLYRIIEEEGIRITPSMFS